jgi:hypothetical protein
LAARHTRGARRPTVDPRHGQRLDEYEREAAVHHLDLVAFCDDPGPGPQSLALVRETLDGLLGHSAPADWDDARYALIGTGRAPLTGAERAALGADAARLPLFG